MKFKGFYYDILFISLLIFGGALFIGVTLLMFDIKVAAVEAVILAVIVLLGFIRMFSARHRYRRMLSLTSKKLDYSDNKVLSNMPLPVAVCDEDGAIKWANERFIEMTGDSITQVSSIGDYLGNEYDADYNKYVKIGERYYLVNTVDFHRDGMRFTAYKFIDNTQLKETEFLYIMSRPYVIIFQTDNIEDNILLSRDSEKSELKSKVDGI
ncbi:MAG: PAS domain-containing protein, partial [Clostridia bacterium]|nr:PAS domain-containing protein [Clostridia bacterium]